MKNKVLMYVSIFLGIIFFAYITKIVFYPEPNGSTTLANIQTLLELLSFVSSPLLLVAALIGLRQLSYAQKEIEITRNIFRTQSKRNSYEAAANECKNFSENVMPLIKQLDKFVKDNKITFFEDVVMKETKNGFAVNLSKANPKQAVKFVEIEELIQNYINDMELFALYFVSRIADENIAFLTVGKLYVKEAERVAMILPITNSTADDCKAIWPLYFSWKSRLKKQQLEKEKNDIEKKLKDITIETRKAIGTE